jgi:tetratricopeptide (TPR) repeat protein
MLDKIRKTISEKRPRGAKLFKILGIFSGVIWMAALGAIFLLKDKKPAIAPESVTAETTGEESPKTVAIKIESEKPKAIQTGASTAKESSSENSGETAAPVKNMPSREEWRAQKQLAELHAASGELEKAVAPMQRVLAMPTRDADLLILATRIYLGTAHYQEALETAEQALVIRPSDVELRVQAIEANYRLGKVARAFEEAHAAVKDHPNNLALLVQLATMEVEMGASFPDYGKTLQAALKLKPDHLPALYLLGRKAQLEGDYKDAEAAFRKVLKVEPKNAKAHGQLGMALYHLGKEADAQREYESELALNPDDYNTWFNVGELQMVHAAQEYLPEKIQALRAEAMESYLKALELNPLHAQAQYRVGVLLNGNGQYKEAIRHLQAALRIDSRHVPTLVQLSLAYENLKQPERAKEYLTKAFELDPLNKVVLFKLKQWS